jgi:hypothetical protein
MVIKVYISCLVTCCTSTVALMNGFQFHWWKIAGKQSVNSFYASSIAVITVMRLSAAYSQKSAFPSALDAYMVRSVGYHGSAHHVVRTSDITHRIMMTSTDRDAMGGRLVYIRIPRINQTSLFWTKTKLHSHNQDAIYHVTVDATVYRIGLSYMGRFWIWVCDR